MGTNKGRYETIESVRHGSVGLRNFKAEIDGIGEPRTSLYFH